MSVHLWEREEDAQIAMESLSEVIGGASASREWIADADLAVELRILADIPPTTVPFGPLTRARTLLADAVGMRHALLDKLDELEVVLLDVQRSALETAYAVVRECADRLGDEADLDEEKEP